MVKCHHLVSEFLTWDVGKGDEALFWEDSWDGHPPIEKSLVPVSLKDRLVNFWGLKVSDYKIESHMDNQSIWIWKSLDEVDLDPKEAMAYKKVISTRDVKQTERKDKLIWVTSNDGKYSAKNGYKALINSKIWEEVEIPLNLCWDPACLPKASFFLWLAFQNKILTVDRLNRIGLVGPSRCVLCKNDCENVDHLLYNFPYSRKCWEWLIHKFGWYSPFFESLKDFLIGWPSHIYKGIYSKLWNISPSILMWEIWKERNRRIFCDKEMNAEELILKIEVSIVENVNSYFRKSRMEEGSFSLWDGTMKNSFPKLINPPLIYSKKCKEARRNFKWSPPP